MNVKSRAVRILGHLRNYRDLTSGTKDIPAWAMKLHLQEGEELIGVYLNRPEDVEESIVVTTKGLYVDRNGRWEFVGYAEIKFIETPADKQTVDRLRLHLWNGRVTEIPVRGSYDRFKDAFEFLRFLDRVISDLECAKHRY